MMLKVYQDSGFKTEATAPLPNIRPVVEKNLYKLFTYYYIAFVFGGARIEIFIPKGFEFDGASIPRAFWSLIGHPFEPRFLVPSLLHDALYGKLNNQVKIWVDGELLTAAESCMYFNQELSDQLFEAFLNHFEVSPATKIIMTQGVKKLGFTRFRKSPNEFTED